MHITARPAANSPGLEATRLASTRPTPIRASARSASARPASETAASAPRRAKRSARRGAGCAELRLEAGQPPRGHVGEQIGRRESVAHREAGGAGAGAPDRERLLVYVKHLGGDVGPREAPRALARRHRHPRAPGGVQRQRAQRLRERARVAAGSEQAVEALAHHVAVAGDVRRHHGRARGERLGEDHPKALPAEGRRTEDVGACELGGLLVLGDLPQRPHPAIVEQQRRDVLGGGPDQGERGGHVLAQRLERAQQHGQALALDGLADEQNAQRRGLAIAPTAIPTPHSQRSQMGLCRHADAGRLEVHAVGHDPVAPAEETPRGPSGGLGDRDAGVQAVHVPARPERHPDPIRERVLGEAVEGAHEREAPGAVGRIPAHQRHHGLVDVHEVVVPAAQLPCQGHQRVRRGGEVGDGPVGGEPCAAPKREDPLGQRHGLRACPAVHHARQGVVGVEGREDPRLVASRPELLGERSDVVGDASRIRPRVGRYERDPHT